MNQVKVVFCWFSAIKIILALILSYNFPTKLISWGFLVLISVDKSLPISL